MIPNSMSGKKNPTGEVGLSRVRFGLLWERLRGRFLVGAVQGHLEEAGMPTPPNSSPHLHNTPSDAMLEASKVTKCQFPPKIRVNIPWPHPRTAILPRDWQRTGVDTHANYAAWTRFVDSDDDNGRTGLSRVRVSRFLNTPNLNKREGKAGPLSENQGTEDIHGSTNPLAPAIG